MMHNVGTARVFLISYEQNAILSLLQVDINGATETAFASYPQAVTVIKSELLK